MRALCPHAELLAPGQWALLARGCPGGLPACRASASSVPAGTSLRRREAASPGLAAGLGAPAKEKPGFLCP